MGIIKKTINFTSNGQVPIDASDQPMYAIWKEVKMHYPSEFGQEKYICALEIFIWNTLVCWFMAVL